ncbi:MAG: hypothetical protein H0Z33_05035 [Bacillaceae bacterium]|nr:hypothetical protein [Bacillaceae bacterium]
MVIQSNMSPSQIVMIWEETRTVFLKYHVSPDSSWPIDKLVKKSQLPTLMTELNKVVGSSDLTCVEGG